MVGVLETKGINFITIQRQGISLVYVFMSYFSGIIFHSSVNVIMCEVTGKKWSILSGCVD